jgi:hypothetical protein
MTTTKFMSMLKAAIFTGTVGLAPGVALADSGNNPPEAALPVPDHSEAEARGAEGSAPSAAAAKANEGELDHAQAEARGGANKTGTVLNEGTSTNVPDHGAAQSRTIEDTTR